MASLAKSAAIVAQTGRLAVRGKNPKLRGAAGSSMRGGGRRDVEGKLSGGSKHGPGAGDRRQGRSRSKHGLAADDKQPAQDEKDDDKEESDDKNNHLSPPTSPGPPLTWKRQPFC